MKTKYLFIVLSILLLSCKNQDDYKDVIFFTGTENSPTVKFSIEGPSDMGISVSSSGLVSKDVAINLDYDEKMVQSYNSEHGTNYQAIPKGSFELSSKETVINTDKFVSKPIKLSITTLDGFEEGVSYMIPLSIRGADMPVLEASRTMYVIINRTIITKAAVLGNNYFTVDFSKNSELESVKAVTMEARVKINKFEASSPFISTVIGIEENFLLRFGDVGVDPNKLQLAGGGFQLASSNGLSTGTWYHLAIVYDGAKLYMYIDGKLDATRDAPRGDINLTDNYSGGFHIGFSVDSRRNLDGVISECRVWKKALSPNELVNNLCYVDPTSEGLLAYWRFNESEGIDIPDRTGNGYTAKATYNVNWVEGVRCP